MCASPNREGYTNREGYKGKRTLQLDAILSNAKRVSSVRAKSNGNQKPFEKMIIMQTIPFICRLGLTSLKYINNLIIFVAN